LCFQGYYQKMWKDNLQKEKKYLQVIYLIRYQEYTHINVYINMYTSRIHKVHLKLNNKNIVNLILKYANDLGRNLSKQVTQIANEHMKSHKVTQCH
jgi:hypothetical protein